MQSVVLLGLGVLLVGVPLTYLVRRTSLPLRAAHLSMVWDWAGSILLVTAGLALTILFWRRRRELGADLERQLEDMASLI